MSYILDALKKADSERQHGKTPGIYSYQPDGDTLEKEEASWNKPLVWVLVVLIILLSAFLVFINLYRTPSAVTSTSGQIGTPPIATNSPAAPIAPNTPPSTIAEPVRVTAPAAAPVAPVAATENSQSVAIQPTESVYLQPSPKLSLPAANEKHEKRIASASVTAASVSPAAKKTSVTKESDLAIETVSTTFRDLPLSIQNEIPTVTVGGYIYSAKREECQLLINKLLLHEGEQVAPGLILERMMPHSAILNYKGNRYRISY